MELNTVVFLQSITNFNSG